MAKQSSDWLWQELVTWLEALPPYQPKSVHDANKEIEAGKLWRITAEDFSKLEQAILSKTKEQALEMLPKLREQELLGVNPPQDLIREKSYKQGWNDAIAQMKDNIRRKK